MRRDPALTYQGALQLLDRYDHRQIEKIDKLLGGIILGAGAAAGISALFGLFGSIAVRSATIPSGGASCPIPTM